MHRLLEFQHRRCGICSTPATFKTDVSGAILCSLVQWVDEGILQGLVCATCRHRYIWLQREPQQELAEAFEAFRTNPPAQRCPATAGLGRQQRPRTHRLQVGPVEAPDPAVWRYFGSVIHVLYLKQTGRCAICSTGLTVQTDPRSVHADHDPKTGLLRGVLCRTCNTCLGQPLNDTWWGPLACAVQAYLEAPPAQRLADTAGLTMSQRNRRAALTLNVEDGVLYLGSMPFMQVPFFTNHNSRKETDRDAN